MYHDTNLDVDYEVHLLGQGGNPQSHSTGKQPTGDESRQVQWKQLQQPIEEEASLYWWQRPKWILVPHCPLVDWVEKCGSKWIRPMLVKISPADSDPLRNFVSETLEIVPRGKLLTELSISLWAGILRAWCWRHSAKNEDKTNLSELTQGYWALIRLCFDSKWAFAGKVVFSNHDH